MSFLHFLHLLYLYFFRSFFEQTEFYGPRIWLGKAARGRRQIIEKAENRDLNLSKGNSQPLKISVVSLFLNTSHDTQVNYLPYITTKISINLFFSMHHQINITFRHYPRNHKFVAIIYLCVQYRQIFVWLSLLFFVKERYHVRA